MNKTVKFAVLVAVILLVVGLFIKGVSFYNTNQTMTNNFNRQMTERTAFYDLMFKTINQNAQIAKKNDESFRQNINIIMEGRKDAEQVMFKWIQETNPNVNYQEVSKMYQQLARVIEAKRMEFFIQEKQLQELKLAHDNLITTFPNNLVASIMGIKKFEYKPITSDVTDNVMKTGKDNNIDLGL